MSVGGISHITLATADVTRSVAFYEDVLGCRVAARWPQGAYLVAGSTWLALVAGGVETRSGEDYSHIAFEVAPHEFDAVARRIVAGGTPQWQDNWTEGDSLYFTDPDGHRLEIHATSLAERLQSAAADPWPGLEINADALAMATRAPSVADRRKPRRFDCAPFAVYVVLFDHADRVLLLRAPGNEAFEVISGAVEAGENLVDAAKRELREEAGNLEVSEPVCFAADKVTYDSLLPSLISVGFACRYRSGDLVPGDDMAGSEFRWCAADEAASTPVFIPSITDWYARALAVVR